MASLLLSAGPLSGAGILIFQGRVTDVRGTPVPGAEIRLTHSGGRLQYRVLSDMRGMYRIPPLPNLAEGYRITVRHLRFKSVGVDDALSVLSGARISSPGPESLVPGQSAALLASTSIISRDFLLAPSAGTPQNPAAGPVDPNLAEYYYQRALLHLARNERSRAIPYLTLYAQLGMNPRQVSHALELIAQNQ